MGEQQLIVKSVSPGGIAAELGVEPGDIILRIDDQLAVDIIDYRFLSAGEEVNILIQKNNGDCWLLEIEKDWDEELGIIFDEGGLGKTKNCRNKCIFCFVDQMPPNMRQSLYVKDDDYRLSFFQGNFITLTNLDDRDLERIVRMHLSPLYISVHTTRAALRVKMMRNPQAGRIMEQLQYLAGGGIEMHTQAVLCPGINDGAELDRTISDLAGLWPAVRSLALVPVGLTACRQGLYPLRAFKDAESRAVIEKVHQWQQKLIPRYNYPLLFAGDEFYLAAGVEVPPASRYGGFPQTENGVGLTRLFLDDWEKVKPALPASLASPRKFMLATGLLAAAVLAPVIERLNEIENLSISLCRVKNDFFGPSVTVAGLVTGGDILKEVTEQMEVTGDIDALIIPGVSVRDDRPVFLDGLTADDLAGHLGVPVITAGTPQDLVRAVIKP